MITRGDGVDPSAVAVEPGTAGAVGPRRRRINSRRKEKSKNGREVRGCSSSQCWCGITPSARSNGAIEYAEEGAISPGPGEEVSQERGRHCSEDGRRSKAGGGIRGITCWGRGNRLVFDRCTTQAPSDTDSVAQAQPSKRRTLPSKDPCTLSPCEALPEVGRRRRRRGRRHSSTRSICRGG